MAKDSMHWNVRFSHRAMKDLASFLSSWNMETQVLASKSAADPDMKTTGTKAYMVDGTIKAYAAEATIDLSNSRHPAAGDVIATTKSRYYGVFIKVADGLAEVKTAGDIALTASVALKLPDFDPSAYVLIGIAKIDNATGSDFTLGTTNLDTGSLTVTYFQVTGPAFPHADNMDAN